MNDTFLSSCFHGHSLLDICRKVCCTVLIQVKVDFSTRLDETTQGSLYLFINIIKYYIVHNFISFLHLVQAKPLILPQ